MAIKLKDAIPRKSDYFYKEENSLLAKRKLLQEMISDGRILSSAAQRMLLQFENTLNGINSSYSCVI